jgi:hypothetical protein
MSTQQGNRRIVGYALVASAVVLGTVAALIYTGVFGVSEQARGIVAGAMGIAAVLDMVLAVYFIVSDS